MHVDWLGLHHAFWLSSCSRIRWKGEIEYWLFGLSNGVSMIVKVDERLNVLTLTKGVGDVTKEDVFVPVLEWSLDLRIGWQFWSLWRAFSRREVSGNLEVRMAKTAMPVPPGMARHQLCSVPPTGRPLGSAICGLISFWIDM